MRRPLTAVATTLVLAVGLGGAATAAAEDAGAQSAAKPAAEPAAAPAAGTADVAPMAGPTADQLRDAVSGCNTQLSKGEYSENAGGSATIPVCESAGGAVHWKADFDVDCDGQRTDECNENTDPWFLPETAFIQSDGQPLNSAELPHIVVPLPSSVWDYKAAGIEGGTVGVAVYEDKAVYAVVGDLGPQTIIGEGSYALAEALGMNPSPSSGGVEGKVVDFILFPGVKASSIEDHAKAVELGEPEATKLVNGCVSYGFSAYPDLSDGSEGAEVKAAQCLLDDAGFPTGDGAPSGVFDTATVTATKEYQTSIGLTSNGTIDSHTWTALLARGDTPTLQSGSSGSAVTRLQRALTAALGHSIDQDGDFGPMTQTAVEDYQTAQGLMADGIVGSATWAALQKGA